MADFFTRVAERALGRRPIVSAVVPSMFAPDPRLASPIPFDAAPMEEGEREVEASVKADAVTSVPERVDEGPRTLPAQATPPRRSQAKVAPAPALELPSSPPRGADFSPRGTLVPQTAVVHTDQLGGTEAPRGLRPAPQEPALREPDVGSTPISPVVPRSQSPREEAKAPLPRDEARLPRVAEAESIQPPPARKPPSMPPFAPEPSPKPQVRERIPARSEPDTIRVTIGRVEVKAVLPPAPRSAPPPKQELSLDDYLKQRKAGQR
jgi:hypothetical protein